jgi:hypothetical protein
VQGEEFEAIQIELDAAPGVLGLHLGEVVGELPRAEGADFKVEMRTDPAHVARTSIDRRNCSPPREKNNSIKSTSYEVMFLQ